MRSLPRRFFLFRTRHYTLGARSHRGRRPSLTTRQGITLLFGIAALVGLVLILVYYGWFLPLERSLQ